LSAVKRDSFNWVLPGVIADKSSGRVHPGCSEPTARVYCCFPYRWKRINRVTLNCLQRFQAGWLCGA